MWLMLWAMMAVLSQTNSADPAWLADFLTGPVQPRKPTEATLSQQPPAADADIESIVFFWSGSKYEYSDRKLTPSLGIRQRLLDYSRDNPEFLRKILWMYTADDWAFPAMKAIHDQLVQMDHEKAEDVREWLKSRTRYFLDDLRTEAANLVFDKYMKGEEALRTLAKLDWASAEKLLDHYEQGANPNHATLAKAIRLEHFCGEGMNVDDWRTNLRHIVENVYQPGYSRVVAFQALQKCPGPDWDVWFLSLFEDPTLKRLSVGYKSFSLLRNPVGGDPDTWIPRLIPLLDDENPTVVHHAVIGLSQFHLQRFREDALRPLVRWIADPDWVRVSYTPSPRLRVIQSMDHGEFPEAVPALIQVAQHETGFYLKGAAQALVHHNAKEAVPALRASLENEGEESHRRTVIGALFKLDGWTADEVIDGMLAFHSAIQTETGIQRLRDSRHQYGDFVPLSIEESLGMYLNRSGVKNAELTLDILVRIESRSLSESTRQQLREQISFWPNPVAETLMLDLLEQGMFTPSLARLMLAKRKHLSETFPERLEQLVRSGGAVAGLIAVVLDREEAIAATLQSNQPARVRACLAAARFLRQELPAEWLSGLLENAAVHDALSAYLELDPREEAIELMRRLAGDAFTIRGDTPGNDPGHHAKSTFGQVEKEFEAEFAAPEPPDEIIALASYGYWTGSDHIVIRRKGNTATLYDYETEDIYRHRVLHESEWRALIQFLEEEKVASLPMFNPMTFDGVQYQFMRLNAQGGYRVFMNNPDRSQPIYVNLVNSMKKLTESEGFERVTPWDTLPPGLERIDLEEGVQAETVFGWDGSLAVLVESEGEDPQWRFLIDDKLGDVRKPPAKFPFLEPFGDIESMVPYHNHYPWMVRSGDELIRALPGGLYRMKDGKRVAKLADGKIIRPMVSSDGLWVIASRTETDWADPNHMILISMADQTVTKIDLPDRNEYDVLTYLEGRHRFLIFQAYDLDGPDETTRIDFYTVDPETGDLERVEGDFWVFGQAPWRPYQRDLATGNLWIAVNLEADVTVFGTFDFETNSYQPRHWFEPFNFVTDSTWLHNNHLYFTHYGDLFKADLTIYQGPVEE